MSRQLDDAVAKYADEVVLTMLCNPSVSHTRLASASLTASVGRTDVDRALLVLNQKLYGRVGFARSRLHKSRSTSVKWLLVRGL